MATIDPQKPNDNNPEKYTFDYYPLAASELTLEQNFALKNHSLTLKSASREQLFKIAIDTFCLLYSTQNMTKVLLGGSKFD